MCFCEETILPPRVPSGSSVHRGLPHEVSQTHTYNPSLEFILGKIHMGDNCLMTARFGPAWSPVAHVNKMDLFRDERCWTAQAPGIDLA